MIEAMKQALEALEAVRWSRHLEDARTIAKNARYSLRQAIEQAEKQEPDLPPVFIGVDVTLKGTQVNAFYRRPNDVAEMFYSEFHPLAKPEQEPVAWMTNSEQDVTAEFLFSHVQTPMHNIPLYEAPPRKPWVGLTDEEIVDLYCQVGDETEWAIGGLKDAMPFANLVEAKLKEKNGG